MLYAVRRRNTYSLQILPVLLHECVVDGDFSGSERWRSDELKRVVAGNHDVMSHTAQ